LEEEIGQELKKQPVFMHEKKKKRKEEKALPPRQGPSWLLHPLGAHRIIPGTTARFYPPVFCLLSTDQSDLFSTLVRK